MKSTEDTKETMPTNQNVTLQNYFDALLEQHGKCTFSLVSDGAKVDLNRMMKVHQAKTGWRNRLSRSMSDRGSPPLSPKSLRWSTGRPTLERRKSDSTLQCACRMLSPAPNLTTQSPSPRTPSPMQSPDRRMLLFRGKSDSALSSTMSLSSRISGNDSPEYSEFRASRIQRSDIFLEQIKEPSSPLSPKSARWSTRPFRMENSGLLSKQQESAGKVLTETLDLISSGVP